METDEKNVAFGDKPIEKALAMTPLTGILAYGYTLAESPDVQTIYATASAVTFVIALDGFMTHFRSKGKKK